jgi:hypothetical protein
MLIQSGVIGIEGYSKTGILYDAKVVETISDYDRVFILDLEAFENR